MPVANPWATLEASFFTMKLKTVETKVRCPHPYRATRHMLQCTLMCPLVYTEVSDLRFAFVCLGYAGWLCIVGPSACVQCALTSSLTLTQA